MSKKMEHGEGIAHFSTNLKFLRKRKGRSQEDVAGLLGIRRTTYSAYELGKSEPNLETLLKLSAWYRLSIDHLLATDLSSTGESVLSEWERSYDTDLKGRHLRILATTIGEDNEDNIEVVPLKARAGYTAGHADPDFIRVLPTFRLPFLSREKKYRTFQIQGDSMPPVPEGAWVTGAFVQDWHQIKDGQPYLVVTKEEGVVFKLLYNRINSNQSFLLCSTNPQYKAYEVAVKDMLEVWEFVHFISGSLEKEIPQEEQVAQAVRELQREVANLKSRFSGA